MLDPPVNLGLVCLFARDIKPVPQENSFHAMGEPTESSCSCRVVIIGMIPSAGRFQVRAEVFVRSLLSHRAKVGEPARPRLFACSREDDLAPRPPGESTAVPGTDNFTLRAESVQRSSRRSPD